MGKKQRFSEATAGEKEKKKEEERNGRKMRGKKERFSGAVAGAKGNKRKKEPQDKGGSFWAFKVAT